MAPKKANRLGAGKCFCVIVPGVKPLQDPACTCRGLEVLLLGVLEYPQNTEHLSGSRAQIRFRSALSLVRVASVPLRGIQPC